MSGKARSRWADTKEDQEEAARLKREKEEKRRRKAEKARKLQDEAEASTLKTTTTTATATTTTSTGTQQDDDRPSKRQKLTPETRARRRPGALDVNDNYIYGDGDDKSHDDGSNEDHDDDDEQRRLAKLLRFDVGTWAPSRSVEKYDKLNDIEEGTYGWVARATELATGKIVALKRLKLEPGDPNGLPVTGLREIQILRDCRHRNIVTMQEVVVGSELSKADNSIYLVFEFVEHDLKTILDDMPEPFLSSEIKRLLLQLASGISYLHTNWILHRDLKTSNLLLNNRGQLKIADFGMARYVGDSPPPQNLTQLVVTLWYRAPELLLGERRYGSSIDMWSVGCIFAELVNRDPLLQGTNEVDQMAKIIELCGVPTEDSWPGFRRLPNARSLRLPPKASNLPASSGPSSSSSSQGSLIRTRFSNLTAAGVDLLSHLLSLDPDRRPSAAQMLEHEYFQQDPKPKPESIFPTFPSKAGQERRRKREPHAPARGGQAVPLGDVDFSGIFQARDREERGAGFTLRMM